MQADRTKYRMYLESDVNPDKRMKCFYVEERSGVVRSALSVTDFGAEGVEICAFTVPEYRRRGLFSALWREAEAMLAARGAEKICFVCEKESADGRAVLRHMGAQKERSEYLLELELAGEILENHLQENGVQERGVQENCFPENNLWESGLQKNSQVDLLHQNSKNGFTVSEFPVWEIKQAAEDGSAELSDEVLKDWDALDALFADCFPKLAASMPDRVSEQIDMGARIWMVKENGVLIGMCVALSEEETAYLFDICVKREWRRRGVAQVLLTAVGDDLRRNGIMRLRLQVSSKNVGAVKLYKKLGFGEKERIDYYRV